MSHRTGGLAVVLVTIPLAVGCARTTLDQRVSEAPPPAVPAPGALIGPPSGWRTLTEGQAPVPIAGHPPVTASGVVASFDPGTAILRFADGRMVKLTGASKVVEPVAHAIRVGDLVVLQEVLPVGVQSGAKTLAVGEPHRMGTVASVDESRGLVQLTDGTVARVTRSTNVHAGAAGSSVALSQVSPGDEVVIVLFLAGPEQHTIPRRMWSGVRDNLSPTIIAAATLLIALSIALMFTLEWLRRRNERLRVSAHRS